MQQKQIKTLETEKMSVLYILIWNNDEYFKLKKMGVEQCA